MDFTVEEINLMCIFDMSSRDSLVSELTDATPDFEDMEMLEIAAAVLDKLSKMTDAEFDALEFYPEYGDYNDEEV